MSLVTTLRDDLTSNLEYAIYYSGLGWGIFPAHTIRNKQCSCLKVNCKSPGKHPMTRNGLKDATTDRSQIIKWWNKNPDANIAIRTGKKSGIVALDIDTKSNGFESLDALQNTFELLPETLTSITGGKGRHICFSHPGGRIKTRSNLFEGIDVRADGGYIIAPPSLHLSGNAYQWADIDSLLVAPPEWLLRLINGKDSSVPVEALEIIPMGCRNSSLMSLAGLKWNQGMRKKELQTFLLEENALRCKPPLGHAEVTQIFESVTSYQRGERNFIFTWRQRFRESDLPRLSKLLLHTLSDHMDSSGRSCYPTQEQLALESSMTRKTVRTQINLCVNEGWIEKYLHKSDAQKFWNYGYIARLPDG